MSETRFEVRPAKVSDLDAVYSLERSIPTAPHWPRAAYASILSENIFIPRRCLMVAVADGLVGFAIGIAHPVGDAELESVAVAEAARRKGVGGALCRAVADWCRVAGASELLLEVRSASNGAIALYRRLGFEPVGTRAGYYRNPPDDALVMRMGLDARPE
jgi:ribosomal-protein-alanine N-acetyltransferase